MISLVWTRGTLCEASTRAGQCRNGSGGLDWPIYVALDWAGQQRLDMELAVYWPMPRVDDPAPAAAGGQPGEAPPPPAFSQSQGDTASLEVAEPH